MKLFFISDIHGSLHYLKLAVKCFEKEQASHIIMLGDALYHGPRNPLPEGYNPKGTAQLLNEYASVIIAVKGNCDCEVDQMLIEYPMLNEQAFVLYNGRRIFLSHGHNYNPDNMPILNKGDAFAFGHIHIPVAENKNGIYILNPGSVSLPKEGTPNSYAILDDERFIIKDLEGNIIKELRMINS